MSNARNNVKTLAEVSATADPGLNGMWPDVTAATKILRMRDRLFVGDGAAATGNNSGTQGGKVPTGVEGANWGIRDAQMVSFATNGNLAVVGFSRSADTTREPCAAIGVAGFAIGNYATRSSWGLYADVQFEQGPYAYGIEVAVKNKSTDQTSTPYFPTTGTYGIWLPGGGDNTYGGSSTNPNNTAIAIGKNSNTWNKGIVFFKDGITGTDGTTGTGVAIEMAKGHSIVWRNSGGTALTIRSDSTSGANDIFLLSTNSTFKIAGLAEATIAEFTHTASAVNYLRFTSAATGNLATMRAQGSDTDVGIQIRTKGTQAVRFQSQDSGTNDEFRVGGVNSAPVNYLHAYGSNTGLGLAHLAAAGTDTNIDIRFTPKGSGLVSFGTHTVNADAPVVGYITIKDSGGTTRKLACIA